MAEENKTLSNIGTSKRNFTEISTTDKDECSHNDEENNEDCDVTNKKPRRDLGDELDDNQPSTSTDFSEKKGDIPEPASQINGGSEDMSNGMEEDAVSEMSDISDLSMDPETGWTGAAGPMSWVQEQMMMGRDPRTVLVHLIPQNTAIPEHIDDITLWKIILEILSEPPKRKKLPHINTLDDVLKLLHESKNIMVLTGAGVSVSCGIPDFRSRDGIYARLAVEYPDLPDPQAMFDIHYFQKNPKPFFKFAKEIYPGQFQPSPSHKFIQLIEKHDKLLRNYTQNIDTLEQVAGIKDVIQCHGSFASATCMVCKYKVNCEEVKEDIMNQVIPRCPHCPAEESMAIMKPDIVFFGESLPKEFHDQMDADKDKCDLLIVIGSSLKVRPVALIPHSLPASVPQILINREPLKHLNFDVELLGDCDVIVNELCHRLGEGWSELCTMPGPCQQVLRDELPTPKQLSPEHCIDHHTIHQHEPSLLDQDDQVCDKLQKTQDNQHKTEAQHSPTEQSDKETEIKSKVDHKLTESKDQTSNRKHSDSELSSTEHAKEQQCSTDKPTQLENVTESNLEKTQEDRASCSAPAPASNDSNEIKEEDLSNENRSIPSKRRLLNLGAQVQDGTFLFLPPYRYVFHGAEIIEGMDDLDSPSSSNSSFTSSSSVDEEHNEEKDTVDNKPNQNTFEEEKAVSLDSGQGDEIRNEKSEKDNLLKGLDSKIGENMDVSINSELNEKGESST